jgi:lysine 2,3-aminomutase
VQTGVWSAILDPNGPDFPKSHAPKGHAMRAAARTLRRPTELAKAGLVPPERLADLERVAAQYAVAISPAMAALIDPADPQDPIARQFVPDPAELQVAPEERGDPIGDDAHSPVVGIVHRYPDRVLLKPVHVCPVYCRFCFRREQVGPRGRPSLSADELAAALDYIRARPQIWEVILTGGDPLLVAPRRLADLKARLDALPHVGVIRVHSRLPVADPDRVTPALIASLRGGRAPVFLLLHANHASEFSDAARAAIARLVDAGIPLLGQSVLLAGVNDTPESLTALFRTMIANRVKPHYLHQGDLARGTGHFRVPIARGQALMKALRGDVSGLCQPSYMLDIPGGYGKVPIGPGYLAADGETWTVEDYRGGRHSYRDG